MPETALLIFAFNRPDHLRETLSHLLNAHGSSDLPLYFFIDGARNSQEANKVKEVEQLARDYPHPHKTIHVSQENKGLRSSVIGGMSSVFADFDAAIVLEDDICVHPDFIGYHLNCLEIYRNRQDIWSVSGYVIPAVGKACMHACQQEVFMAPKSSSWGWSTWKSRWEQAVWDKQIIARHLRLHVSSYRQTGGDKLRMLLRELSGKSSSWAILWDYSHFMHGAACIYPNNSLVINIGLDYSGTHSKPSKAYTVSFSGYRKIVQFPPDIAPQREVYRIFGGINRKWYREPLDWLNFLRLCLSGPRIR